MSQQIQRLEDELGVKLSKPQEQHISLTIAGENIFGGRQDNYDSPRPDQKQNGQYKN